jgi:DNA-binding NarL/FixJ family response regulator
VIHHFFRKARTALSLLIHLRDNQSHLLPRTRVGEASSFRETIQKTAELQPDLIVLDVHLAGEDHTKLTEVKSLLNGAKVLAITFDADRHTGKLAESVGAVKLLDKMDLSDQLIPAILELGEAQSSQTAA